jgi:exosome complex RNA-binding protein Csl4
MPMNLKPYYCSKCKRFLIKALPNAQVYCPKCNKWNK